MKNSENGRSMIEMMGVLAVIGVLSTAGISGYIKMMAQYKINKAVEQIEQISAKLSTIGSSVESYEGLNNKSAVKSDAVPSEAIIGDGTNLENPFGGTIVIAAAPLLAANDNQAYTIIYTDLPEDACIALGSLEWNTNSNFVGIGIAKSESTLNSSSVLPKILQRCQGRGPSGEYLYACSEGSNITFPISLSRVADTCNCSDDACAIALKYF